MLITFMHVKERSGRLDITINEKQFNVYASANGSCAGVDIKYDVNLTGLKKFIPAKLQHLVKCEYKTNYINKNRNVIFQNNTATLYGCNLFNFSFKIPMHFSWYVKNIMLYVPYASITGKILYIAVSLDTIFKNVKSTNTDIYNVSNINYNYSEYGNRRYDYNMNPVTPNAISYIRLTPNTRNSNLLIDDWYIFSDTIMTVKTGNSYKSKNINNYYCDYAKTFSIDAYQNNLKYFIGTITNSFNVVHNLGELSSSIANSKVGAYVTSEDANTFINGISIPISGYFNINDSLYFLGEKTLTINNEDESITIDGKARAKMIYSDIIKLNPLYDHANFKYFKKSNGVFKEDISTVLLPLMLRSDNNKIYDVNADGFANSMIKSYETDKNTSVASSPFRFHPYLTHMIIRHNFLTSCEEFLTVINGIEISNNMFNVDDYSNENHASVLSVNTSWPPANYLNGLNSTARSAFNNSVGMAYPMVSGMQLSSDEASGLTYNFYLGNDADYVIPWNAAPTTLYDKPQYFGIPYIRRGDNMAGIRYKIEDGQYKTCTTFLGGQTETVDGFFANAMPNYDKFNIPSNQTSFIKSDVNLLEIYNLYKISNDLISRYGKSTASNINLSIKYDREFIYYNNYNCNILYSPNLYGSSLKSYGNVSGIFYNDDDQTRKAKINAIRNVFSNLANNLQDGNDGVIVFRYSSEDINFEHWYTNINKSQVSTALKDILFVNGIPFYYDTEIKFENVWDWNIFFQTYMHKLYFVTSKLNQFYKRVFSSDGSKQQVALNLSFGSIVNHSPASLFFGTSSAVSTTNVNFTKASHVNTFISYVGQLYYPVGKYSKNSKGGIIMQNSNSNDKSNTEFFTDRNSWGVNDFNMNKILNGNSCQRTLK